MAALHDSTSLSGMPSNDLLSGLACPKNGKNRKNSKGKWNIEIQLGTIGLVYLIHLCIQ